MVASAVLVYGIVSFCPSCMGISMGNRENLLPVQSERGQFHRVQSVAGIYTDIVKKFANMYYE